MSDTSADKAFGAYVRKTGMATDDQLWAARKIQEESTRVGKQISLSEALVRQGAITPLQRETVEKKVEARRDEKNRLGPYHLLNKIGEGGMGAVYLAEDSRIGRKVALKVLPKEKAKDPGFLRRFQREVEAARRLQHVNIAMAYEPGEDKGYHFYSMEYCEGEALDHRLKRDEYLRTVEATGIVIQVARGLKYAHEMGFIHRDIKPANVVMIAGGVAKILDFGLTKNISESEQSFRTVTGMAIGTPHYIAPEQARGEKDVDGRADIYSLGATYYHLITGDTPFHGSSTYEVITRHLTDQLPDPRDVRDGVPDGAVHVIMRMLAKKPEDRYRNCEELLADLELVIDGRNPASQVLEAARSSVAMRLPQREREQLRAYREKQRRRAAPRRASAGSWIAGAGIAAAGAAVMVAMMLSSRKADPGPSPVSLPSKATARPSPAPVVPPAAAPVPTAPVKSFTERARDREARFRLDELKDLEKTGRIARDGMRQRYAEFVRAYGDTEAGRMIADWLVATESKPDEPAPAPAAAGGGAVIPVGGVITVEPRRLRASDGRENNRYRENSGRFAIAEAGSAEATVAVSKGGSHQVVVTASCDAARGELARFKLSLSGKPVGTETALTTDKEKDYAFAWDAVAGEHVLAIEFTNDLNEEDGAVDRNLYIHRIVVRPSEERVEVEPEVTPVIPAPVAADAGGLLGSYYAFTGSPSFGRRPVVSRVDPAIDFAWKGAPAPGVAGKNFCIRWTGQVVPPASETFAFHVSADDGVRLWVNGKLLVDQWKGGALRESSGNVSLREGVKVNLVLEYAQFGGGGTVRLSWSSPSMPKELVPTNRLHPVIGATIREPVPPAARVREAEKGVREFYKAEYAKGTATDMVALAQRLLKQAGETQGGVEEEYVLLREARQLAIRGFDPALALEASHKQAEIFDVDEVALKSDALARMVPAAREAPTAGMLARRHLDLVSGAMEAGDYEEAAAVAVRAEPLARLSKDEPLLARAQVRIREATEARGDFQKVKAADKALKQDADDPAASLAMGLFLCLDRGDWARGLPFLARGSDAPLQELARKDVEAGADARAAAELSEGWLAQAEKERGPGRKLRLVDRGRLWFLRASRGLPESDKYRLEKRVTDLERGVLARLEVDLLRTINPQKDLVPPWSMNGATLVSQSTGMSGLRLPYVLPDEYDLIAVVERKGGGNLFRIDMPYGGRGVSLLLEHQDNGATQSRTSEDTLFGPGIGERVFKVGAPVTVRCQVRRKGLVVTVDGRLLEWVGDDTKLPVDPQRPPGMPHTLGLATNVGTFHLSRLSLFPISGPGRPLPR